MAHQPLLNPIESFLPNPLRPPASIREEVGEFDAVDGNRWIGTNCAVLRCNVIAKELDNYRGRSHAIIISRPSVPSLERFAAEVDAYTKAFEAYRAELERLRVVHKSQWLETTYESDPDSAGSAPVMRMIPKSPRAKPDQSIPAQN